MESLGVMVLFIQMLCQAITVDFAFDFSWSHFESNSKTKKCQ